MNWKLIRIIDATLGIPLLRAAWCLGKLRLVRGHAAATRPVRRILLVKFWGIGNLFMMLPSVALLRDAHPGAEIDLLTLETNRAAAECTQAFSNVRTVDTKGYLRFLGTTLSSLWTLHGRDYDVIIDFEQFARFSALCVAAIGGRETVGFETRAQHRHHLFTRPVAYDNTVHVTRSYCSLVQAAGVAAERCAVPSFQVCLPELDEGANDLLGRLGVVQGRRLVVLHVGTSSNFSERRWPTEHYASLADRLIENDGAMVVLTGLPEERQLAAAVRDRVRHRQGIIDASGSLSFREYFTLIRSSKLVISADTAAVHIASAAGVPVAGLYGPNTPLLYGPWGAQAVAFYEKLSCSPCITNFNAKTHDCRHPEGKGACMRKLDPDRVYQVIHDRFFAVPSVRPEGKSACVP